MCLDLVCWRLKSCQSYSILTNLPQNSSGFFFFHEENGWVACMFVHSFHLFLLSLFQVLVVLSPSNRIAPCGVNKVLLNWFEDNAILFLCAVSPVWRTWPIRNQKIKTQSKQAMHTHTCAHTHRQLEGVRFERCECFWWSFHKYHSL